MPRILSARMIGYILLLFLADYAVMPRFQIGGIYAWITPLFILYAAFTWSWHKTLLLAFLIGLIRDLGGVHPLGVETSVMLMNTCALLFFVQKMERQSMLVRMFCAWGFVFTGSVLLVVLSGIIVNPEWITWTAVRSSFGFAFYSALILPVFFLITSRWFHDVQPIRQYGLFGSGL